MNDKILFSRRKSIAIEAVDWLEEHDGGSTVSSAISIVTALNALGYLKDPQPKLVRKETSMGRNWREHLERVLEERDVDDCFEQMVADRNGPNQSKVPYPTEHDPSADLKAIISTDLPIQKGCRLIATIGADGKYHFWHRSEVKMSTPTPFRFAVAQETLISEDVIFNLISRTIRNAPPSEQPSPNPRTTPYRTEQIDPSAEYRAVIDDDLPVKINSALGGVLSSDGRYYFARRSPSSLFIMSEVVARASEDLTSRDAIFDATHRTLRNAPPQEDADDSRNVKIRINDIPPDAFFNSWWRNFAKDNSNLVISAESTARAAWAASMSFTFKYLNSFKEELDEDQEPDNTWCTEENADPLGDILSTLHWHKTGEYPSEEQVEELKKKWLERKQQEA